MKFRITWSPPEILAGPLASYHLQINSTSSDKNNVSIVKDFDIKKIESKVSKQNGRPIFTYTTGALSYGTMYNVYLFTISKSNIQGEMATRQVLTANPKTSVDDGPGYLYFSEGKILFKKKIVESVDIYDPSEKVREFETNIKALERHVSKNWIIVLDEIDNIHILDSVGNTTAKILNLNLNGIIKELSVDWLNDLIYVVVSANGIYSIRKCNFNGKCDYLQIDIQGMCVFTNYFFTFKITKNCNLGKGVFTWSANAM